ncbi:MAG: hypothetical protein Greene101415_321, partial [Parcubacteria group bacterium Greene1014_15]
SGVLLSAGTKYRGVDALHAIRDIVPSQRLFFVSSKDDISSYGSNYDMNIELMDALKKEVSRKLVVYNSAGQQKQFPIGYHQVIDFSPNLEPV